MFNVRSLFVLFSLIIFSIPAYAQASAKDDFKKGIDAINAQNGSAAIIWFDKGFAKIDNGEKLDEATLLNAKIGQATAHFLVGKTLKAENIIQPLLADIRRIKGEFSADNVAANYLLALSFQLSGQYQQSVNSYEILVKLQEKAGNTSALQRAQILKNLSSVYQQLGKYQKALKSEDKALLLLQQDKPSNIDSIIATYNRLSFLAGLIGDNAMVLDYLKRQYTEQISAYGESNSESIRMLAWIDKTIDNNKNLLSGNDLNSLGGFNLNVFEIEQLGSPEQAEAFYNNIAKQYGAEHPLALKSLSRLADSLSLYSQYDRAIPLYEKIIKQHIKVFPKAGADRAGLYLRLSQAYELAYSYGDTKQRINKAKQAANKSIELYEELYGDVHLKTITALNQLWKLTRFTVEANQKSFILASRIWGAYSKLEQRVLPYMNKQQRIGFRRNFSELKDNFLESAWSLNQKFLFKNAFENSLYWGKNVKHAEAIKKAESWQEIQVLLDEQLQEIKQANAKDESIRKKRHEISQQVIMQLYDQWMRYKGGISAIDNALLLARTRTNDENEKQNIEELLALLKQQAQSFVNTNDADGRNLAIKITKLQSALSKTIPELQLEKRLNTTELIKSLDSNTVFIDFARYLNSEYMVFIIEPNGRVHIRRLTGGLEASDKINQTIRKLRTRIDSIIDGEIPFVGSEKKLIVSQQQLYDAIILPIDDIIKKYQKIISSPDGLLSLLPLNILRDKTTGKYLIERFTVQTIPSAREWLRLQLPESKNIQPTAVTIYANPDFNAGSDKNLTACASEHPNRSAREVLMKTFKQDCIPALPATAEEASIIASLLTDAEVFTNAKANEEAFLKLTSPRILHLATHGFFIPDPAITNPLEKSGIILSGANVSLANGKTKGIVTGLKLASLNLSGTELVVLSACETGVGDVQAGEGVSGLNQAFIRAGAKGVVMSLWRVPDKATSKLMTFLYKAVSKGATPAAALRDAQLQFIKQNLHPLSWAAFVYNG